MKGSPTGFTFATNRRKNERRRKRTCLKPRFSDETNAPRRAWTSAFAASLTLAGGFLSLGTDLKDLRRANEFLNEAARKRRTGRLVEGSIEYQQVDCRK